MQPLKETRKEYFDELDKRAKKSRVSRPYQLIGLEIADILGDRKHKALYIKLAKERDPEKLLQLAKSVAERKNVSNKGAYFMKLIQETK
jgi:hypothetical protein